MNYVQSHQLSHKERALSLLSKRRFQLAGALLFGALIPWAVRGFILGRFIPIGQNALCGNTIAILVAFWARYSVETFPGIRRSYVILPTCLTAHGIIVAWFVMTRFPYDRVALAAGFIAHVVWLYWAFFYGERRVVRRIAVVPYGGVQRLVDIASVEWVWLKEPNLDLTRRCDAIVADFSADLQDEWEAFLAEAALAGRIVYQHKQLMESLTGRVELEKLSENSFGSLVPSRGYFYFKSAIDFAVAVICLPLLLPLLALIVIIIRLDSKGPALFRQRRVGYAGRNIIVYKFRTMRISDLIDDRESAITRDGDDRITRVGRVLRNLRLDEIPQVFNILKFEMSWIGPRPEAEVLSTWYASELPFYPYRHVVKPGISGWAQVNQGHVASMDEVHRKLQYDFYYIKYFSPWLDLLILVRTIRTMLTGDGAK
jgi:lipopolysaccharide/colanic/teichoic acid biosynthesis glycosyltransferase